LKRVVKLFAITAILFFSGCSSKKVYEPKETAGSWKIYGSSDEKLIDIASDTALLENKAVISKKDRYLDVQIADDYRVIGLSDGWILSADIDGNLTLDGVDEQKSKEHLELKKTIAGASVQGDVLAILFADNEMALYSIATKEPLFKEQGNPSLIVDSRIVNPQFMNDLVLFSTLDGRVIIVNSELKKRLRTIIVSSEEHFNNIIYFSVIQNKLIAATGHKLFALAEKEIRANYEVRTIVADEDLLYATTKQGELIALDLNLDLQRKMKFPFAHFLGMIVDDEKLYLLEKQGYLIEVAKDFSSHSVYEVDVRNGFVFVADKLFYIDDSYISVR
jgi:hypothetical protein